MSRVIGEFVLFILIGMVMGRTLWGARIADPMLDGVKKLFKWTKEATWGSDEAPRSGTVERKD